MCFRAGYRRAGDEERPDGIVVELCRQGRRRYDNLSCEAEQHQEADDHPRQIDLPPLVPMPCRAGIGVMIIVPALAAGEERDQSVIAAVVGSPVVAITPDMGDRIDRPGGMPNDDGPQRRTPDKQTLPELQGVSPAAPRDHDDTDSEREIGDP